MGGWTGGAREGSTSRRISHMAPVIRAVQIFAVPAGGKDDGRSDPSSAYFSGESGSVTGVTWCST